MKRHTDTIPAWLTEGEMVMNNEASGLLGREFLAKANQAGLALRNAQGGNMMNTNDKAAPQLGAGSALPGVLRTGNRYSRQPVENYVSPGQQAKNNRLAAQRRHLAEGGTPGLMPGLDQPAYGYSDGTDARGVLRPLQQPGFIDAMDGIIHAGDDDGAEAGVLRPLQPPGPVEAVQNIIAAQPDQPGFVPPAIGQGQQMESAKRQQEFMTAHGYADGTGKAGAEYDDYPPVSGFTPPPKPAAPANPPPADTKAAPSSQANVTNLGVKPYLEVQRPFAGSHWGQTLPHVQAQDAAGIGINAPVYKATGNGGGFGEFQFKDGRGLSTAQTSGLAGRMAYDQSQGAQAARDANAAISAKNYADWHKMQAQDQRTALEQQALNVGDPTRDGLGAFIGKNRAAKSAQTALGLNQDQQRIDQQQGQFDVTQANERYKAELGAANEQARLGLDRDRFGLEQEKARQGEYGVYTDPDTQKQVLFPQKGALADMEYQSKLPELQRQSLQQFNARLADPEYQAVVKKYGKPVADQLYQARLQQLGGQ